MHILWGKNTSDVSYQVQHLIEQSHQEVKVKGGLQKDRPMFRAKECMNCHEVQVFQTMASKDLAE